MGTTNVPSKNIDISEALMLELLLGLAILSIPVFLLIIIIQAIRRKTIKYWGITLLALLLFVIIGFVIDIKNDVDSSNTSQVADKAFLEDIEKSILYRMEATSTENYDEATVVNTELAYLKTYQLADFEDPRLEELADKYINGLFIQKNALKQTLYCDYQYMWLRGMVSRYKVLDELYMNYDFLSDNVEFIGAYIAQVEDKEYLLKAYDTINKDISAQRSKQDFYWYPDYNSHQLSCFLVNNTEYTFSAVFEIHVEDANGVSFDSKEVFVDNIRPGSEYVVATYISDLGRVERVSFTNYYDYIK